MVKPTVCQLRRDSNRVVHLVRADEVKPALVEALKLNANGMADTAKMYLVQGNLSSRTTFHINAQRGSALPRSAPQRRPRAVRARRCA
jgi:hypothetical protein